MTVRLAIIIALLLGCGCTTFRQHDRRAGEAGLHVVSGVPSVAQQSRSDCGAAALAALLAHRGREMPVATIAQKVDIPELGGSLPPDLENFARGQGFETRSGRGDLALLRRQVDAGRPVIVPVQLGFWHFSRPHYLVVFGYTDRDFLVHAGTGEGLFIAGDELADRWAKMNSLYLYLE